MMQISFDAIGIQNKEAVVASLQIPQKGFVITKGSFGDYQILSPKKTLTLGRTCRFKEEAEPDQQEVKAPQTPLGSYSLFRRSSNTAQKQEESFDGKDLYIVLVSNLDKEFNVDALENGLMTYCKHILEDFFSPASSSKSGLTKDDYRKKMLREYLTFCGINPSEKLDDGSFAIDHYKICYIIK